MAIGLRLRQIRAGAIRRARRFLVTAHPASRRPGSAIWLRLTEQKYGGIHRNVRRNRISPLDSRQVDKQWHKDGMTGGDRMSPEHHNYARTYERYLSPFIGKPGLTIVEVGILRGTGLAIWSELFPGATLVGLDIDLEHCRNNLGNLTRRGAFPSGPPQLYEFDQFADNAGFFASILGDRRIDIMIDDGHHSNEAIINTIRAATPHLAKDFVYFIEDNRVVADALRPLFPELSFSSFRELTVAGRADRVS